MTPPKVFGAANPTSSVMIMGMFGAPFGGTTRGIQHGFESMAFRLISPPDFSGGDGKYFELRVYVAAGEHLSAAGGCANVSLAATVARESAVSAIRRTLAA